MSLSVSTFVSRGISSPSFLFIFSLPTGERSYLFSSKNNPLKSSSAASTVDGSPGRSFLYISISASSRLLTLSVIMVSLKDGRYLTLSMKRSSMESSFRAISLSSTSSVMDSLLSRIISPVSGSMISFSVILPIISSRVRGISSTPELASLLRATFVILLPSLRITSPVSGALTSNFDFTPAIISETGLVNLSLPWILITSEG
ncbi:hypothetical protein BMS3Bbin07_01324 [bacterium BMS3Bbin07]|nr:hypothetical protein BMS3Bbin07_01324 [bacterium BMS3Bbin07]